MPPRSLSPREDRDRLDDVRRAAPTSADELSPSSRAREPLASIPESNSLSQAAAAAERTAAAAIAAVTAARVPGPAPDTESYVRELAASMADRADLAPLLAVPLAPI